MSNNYSLTAFEKKNVCLLACFYVIRMFGLFMVLPLLALYAIGLEGATPSLVGMALGIFGLSQALLQIPFGWLSDKWGRKPILFIGMLFLIVGSLVAAYSDSIAGLILGRALQGMGAIGSTLLAFVSDVSRPEVRTRAMAIIGITIGGSFLLSVVLGPLAAGLGGVSLIFWLTAILGGIGLLLWNWLPNFKVAKQQDWREFHKPFANPQLMALSLGIFVLHACLTANFLVLPVMVQQVFALEDVSLWRFLLPVLIASIILMMPLLRSCDDPERTKICFLLSITVLILSQGLTALLHFSSIWLSFSAVLFFTAFNLLEALLPSLVSKVVPSEQKGASLGIYSTFQFMGIFVGGALGGLLNQHIGTEGVLLGSALALGLWLFIARHLSESQLHHIAQEQRG